MDAVVALGRTFRRGEEVDDFSFRGEPFGARKYELVEGVVGDFMEMTGIDGGIEGGSVGISLSTVLS